MKTRKPGLRSEQAQFRFPMHHRIGFYRFTDQRRDPSMWIAPHNQV
ncbi:MAG: hypothetical protein JXA89_18535 [Anaerolineae bacterium]|nr:hypothetical protein [Anaerolineae bacterium]